MILSHERYIYKLLCEETFYDFYIKNTNYREEIKIKFPIIEYSESSKGENDKYNDTTCIIVNLQRINYMINRKLKKRFTNIFYFEINKDNNCELLLNIESNGIDNFKPCKTENKVVAKITFGLISCNIEYYYTYGDNSNYTRNSKLLYEECGDDFWKYLIKNIYKNL